MASWLRASLFPIPAFALLGVGLAMAVARPEAPVGDGTLDRPLPAFSQPPLAGTDRGLSKSDLAGTVVLLNVFASWCGTCRAEHPMLMQLAAVEDVPIFGLNWKDRKGAGKLFLERYGNPYSGTGADADGALGRLLNVTGVPETYLIDAEGRIRYRHLGPVTEATWRNILAPRLAELRNEP